MVRSSIIVAILILSAQPASAFDEAAFLACATSPDGAERLKCYDQLAAPLLESDAKDFAPEVSAPSAQPVGKWTISRDKNPLDDTETVIVSLKADQGESRFGDKIYFIARCMSNRTEAYITWNDYLGNDGNFRNEYKIVTVRVGTEEAEAQRWSISTDNNATFAPSWAGDLLKRMSKATSMVARTTPFNENPSIAVFDTTGMRAAISPIAEVCQWDLPG